MKKNSYPDDGILLIHKSIDMTSTQALNIVKKNCHISSLGHAGTLDPFATGLLISCVNRATKLIPYFQDLSKTYESTMVFGSQTDTDDRTGKVIQTTDNRVNKQQVQNILKQFTGKIMQQPPSYSALKVNGKRAYELSRQNIDFKLNSRAVSVHQLDLIDFDEERQSLKLHIVCSKGTYIRSLARDIGIALDSLGHVQDLCRTHIGNVSIKSAIAESEVGVQDIIPIQDFFQELPSVYLKSFATKLVMNGADVQAHFIENTSFQQDGYIPTYYRLYDHQQEFLGIIDNQTHKALYKLIH